MPLTRNLLATIILVGGANSASAATLFDNYLERGYSEVAVYARTAALNDLAGAHFARKAADAADGALVLPDSPADTGRPLPYLVEFYDARTRLMEALAAGAAKNDARMAAVAQVNYDCWLAQLSAKPGDPDHSSCRLLFYTALDMITDPGIDGFVTVAGPTGAVAVPSDDAAGGNDSTDRLPAPWQAGPISALSSISGEYETAAWIYPAPIATPPASSVVPGGGPDTRQGVSTQVDDGDGDSGATGDTPVGGVSSGLGGTASRASESLGGAVSGVGGALGDTAGGVARAAGSAVSGAGNAIGGPVGGIAGTAGAAVSGLGGATGDAVGDVADAAGRAVSNLGGGLGGALGGLGRDRGN